MLLLLATTLVVCAPGYPGSTAEAQPAMDALARSVTGAAHLSAASLSAVYAETSEGGLRRLADKDAALLLAPLPFYLEHERELRLEPRMMAAPQGGAPLEQWSLVTGKDHPPSLAGYTVQSTAGYSRRFVRSAAPSLPPDVNVVASSTVLSALRRAANGEKVAVLVDATQGSAIASLPFASSLAVIERSPPVPVAVLATVGKRLDARRWKALQVGFAGLAGDPAATETLQGIRMSAFLPIDSSALARARTRWQGAK